MEMKPRQRVVSTWIAFHYKHHTHDFYFLALIENITTVPDYSNAIDGAPNVSLLIQTSNRPLKLTAPTMEKHELWFEVNDMIYLWK